MTEKYLHYIWKSQRINIDDLKLIHGQSIIIKNRGNYNENEKGPDFSHGTIRIDDVDLHGSIEIHIKSSDWYKHNHHNDRNYDNVILHVVYENDLQVCQNGVIIPTIELKNSIELTHLIKSKKRALPFHSFPCEGSILKLDHVYLESMKISALVQKLNTKNKILEELKENELAAIFYYLLGTSFGMSVNKEGFEKLIQRVPHRSLLKLNRNQRYKLLLSESGLLSCEQISHWHKKGTRPRNFPIKRIQQFAQVASSLSFTHDFVKLSSIEMKNNFTRLITMCLKEQSALQFPLSLVNHLLINAVVPLLWFYGEKSESQQMKDNAIELLSLLPQENNAVILRWKKMGVAAHNAYDSQALLALNRYYCTHKKCLTCAIGKKMTTE